MKAKYIKPTSLIILKHRSSPVPHDRIYAGSPWFIWCLS